MSHNETQLNEQTTSPYELPSTQYSAPQSEGFDGLMRQAEKVLEITRAFLEIYDGH